MKNLLKLSALILAFVLGGSPSCNEEEKAERESQILDQTRMKIRKEFESEYLSESLLYAFEQTAKQKLSDLPDYFSILADSTLDYAFRKRAAEMIKQTFVPYKTIDLTLFIPEITKEPAGINQLISNVMNHHIKPASFAIDSIQLKEPLHRTGDQVYAGILAFKRTLSDSPQANKSLIMISEIFVAKELKAFGTDTLNIWVVKLGDIK